MRYDALTPPRSFTVGSHGEITIHDFGAIALDADEQVTFVTAQGGEIDVVRKAWGFYATPSTNKRLASFGLRAVLVRNRYGHAFVLVCEAGHEAAFDTYVASERLDILTWLDTDDAVSSAAAKLLPAAPPALAGGIECPCDSAHLRPRFAYDAPPPGETPFAFACAYRREYHECEACGHFVAAHDLDLSSLYDGAYVDATYGREKMRASFERVINLPPERSDNVGRAARVDAFARERATSGRRLLDVGSGLGVFPRAMRLAGWDCTALDPDPTASELCGELAGVHAVCADFFAADPRQLGRYDAVTLNKVVEHVAEPVAMLRRAAAFVAEAGFVYIEVPDSAAADDADGPHREEFFVEHLHVFSPASLAASIARAGLHLVDIERLVEPSGKYTLCAFATVGTL
ncbi:MAG: class I SAM-dependent methyltransferase [Acidimicrobiia bacterium]